MKRLLSINPTFDERRLPGHTYELVWRSALLHGEARGDSRYVKQDITLAFVLLLVNQNFQRKCRLGVEFLKPMRSIALVCEAVTRSELFSLFKLYGAYKYQVRNFTAFFNFSLQWNQKRNYQKLASSQRSARGNELTLFPPIQLPVFEMLLHGSRITDIKLPGI